MKRNISNADKLVRLVIVLIIAILYFTNTISGTWTIILGVVALAMLVTSFLNFCPIWAAIGINTFKKKDK